VHAINLVWMLFELLMNRIHTVPAHCGFVVIWLLACKILGPSSTPSLAAAASVQCGGDLGAPGPVWPVPPSRWGVLLDRSRVRRALGLLLPQHGQEISADVVRPALWGERGERRLAVIPVLCLGGTGTGISACRRSTWGSISLRLGL
jgi:hypothetical protein